MWMCVSLCVHTYMRVPLEARRYWVSPGLESPNVGAVSHPMWAL